MTTDHMWLVAQWLMLELEQPEHQGPWQGAWRESLAHLNRRFTDSAPSPCETFPEASARHHWQYSRPAAGYQLTITASARFVLNMSPLLYLGPLLTSDLVE